MRNEKKGKKKKKKEKEQRRRFRVDQFPESLFLCSLCSLSPPSQTLTLSDHLMNKSDRDWQWLLLKAQPSI